MRATSSLARVKIRGAVEADRATRHGFCARIVIRRKDQTLEFGKGKVDFRAVFAEMKQLIQWPPAWVRGEIRDGGRATANAKKYLERV
jgi:hypothetical protein